MAEAAQEIRDGRCAKCGGHGQVDFHKSAFVWSALIVTQRRTESFIGCKGCALKQQALQTAGTLVAGWWGFPWGFVFTPIALVSNAWYMPTVCTTRSPVPTRRPTPISFRSTSTGR